MTTVPCPAENCTYDPRPLVGEPIGMFHCPGCGRMVVAGLPHPAHMPCELCGAGAWNMTEDWLLRDLYDKGMNS